MANKKPKAAPAAPPQSGGIKGWLSRNWSYLAAFFLPVVLIYVAYLIFLPICCGRMRWLSSGPR